MRQRSLLIELITMKGEIYSYTDYHVNILPSHGEGDLLDLIDSLSLDDPSSKSRSEGILNCSTSM